MVSTDRKMSGMVTTDRKMAFLVRHAPSNVTPESDNSKKRASPRCRKARRRRTER
jgi:hypothetical protein